MIDKNEITIRKATREDAIPATELLKRLGLILPEGEGIDRFWDRLWIENPYYEYFDEERLYGWVMEHEGRMTGFFGCIPRVYLLNGEPRRVAIASQWGVEKGYREFTGMLCEAFFKKNPIDIKLVTTAIKPTGRIFERYGGKPVPCPELGKVYMIPIRLKHLLAGKFPRVKGLARLIGSAVPYSRRFRGIKEDKEFKRINTDKIPAEVDEFLRGFSKQQKGLFALRSSNTIDWLYRDNFRGLTTQIFVLYNGSKVSGYAALVDEPVADMPEIQRLKVVDLLAGSPQIRKRLLKQLARFAHRSNADVLELHLPGTVVKEDIQFLTITRDLPQFPVYYHCSDQAIGNLLKYRGNWHISPFDGDSCLV